MEPGGIRTRSTEAEAAEVTLWAVPPSPKETDSPRPWLESTIISAFQVRAVSRISSDGLPDETRHSTRTPSSRTSRATSSR